MVQILPLSGQHDRKTFDCGDEALNQWLAQVASQHKAKGVSSTYVAVDEKAPATILGYYAISVTEIAGDELSPAWNKRLPTKIPAFRIGRLAVASICRGKRLGALLLGDAITRIRRVALDVGGVFILVNAKPDAVGFYHQYGFEPMSDHPLKLQMLI